MTNEKVPGHVNLQSKITDFINYKDHHPAVFDKTALASWNYDSSTDFGTNLFWTASTRKEDQSAAWLLSATEGRINLFSKTKADDLATLCVSDPRIDDATYARPIEVAAANESECKVCTDWSDDSSCTQPATFPSQPLAGPSEPQISAQSDSGKQFVKGTED